MFNIIKSFFGSIKEKLGRLQLKMFFIRNIPGMYGVLIRSKAMRKHFAQAGDNLNIHEGFRFRNIHKLLLGNNVTIGINAYIQAGGTIEIGDNTAFGWKVTILTHEFNQIHQRFGKVKIGENVLVGGYSIIRSGVRIGDNSVICPNSVVVGDIPPNEIWGGNPAVKIRDNDLK